MVPTLLTGFRQLLSMFLHLVNGSRHFLRSLFANDAPFPVNGVYADAA